MCDEQPSANRECTAHDIPEDGPNPASAPKKNKESRGQQEGGVVAGNDCIACDQARGGECERPIVIDYEISRGDGKGECRHICPEFDCSTGVRRIHEEEEEC